ncbi:hypothetical protein EJ02DRAFT_451101 [Clathrospora elynae]|uniref:Uncharacterized protein n=1 Tax=Clathrospora elynae TaxID=706981 RepID=A0A6A5T0C2_9PLEO|nr:hypothetical protein EJ02DRAFT_451101 [Clathrospora elynae]
MFLMHSSFKIILVMRNVRPCLQFPSQIPLNLFIFHQHIAQSVEFHEETMWLPSKPRSSSCSSLCIRRSGVVRCRALLRSIALSLLPVALLLILVAMVFAAGLRVLQRRSGRASGSQPGRDSLQDVEGQEGMMLSEHLAVIGNIPLRCSPHDRLKNELPGWRALRYLRAD